MTRKHHTCVVCRARVPVADAVGLKIGSKTLAACVTCAPQVREAAFSLGVLLRRVVDSKFPYVGQAFDMTVAMLAAGTKK